MANQEPFTFGNGNRTQEQIPHSGVHHGERPVKESDIPLAEARLETPSSPEPLAPLADVQPLARTSSHEGFFRKHRRAIAAAALTTILGGGAALVAHERGSTDPGAKDPSIGTIDHPGTTEGKFVIPENRPTLPEGALEGINEKQWGDIFNMSIRSDLNWYVDTLLENPDAMDEVPADFFTDTPDSQLVSLLKEAATEIREANPDAVDYFATVCPASVSTSSEMYGCTEFSNFISSSKENPGLSDLTIQHYAQNKDGSLTSPQTYSEDLTEPYELAQQPDGTFKINEQ